MQKTKSILSQYKDEVPVVNLEEAPPVVSAEVEPDEDNSKDSEIQVITIKLIYSQIDDKNEKIKFSWIPELVFILKGVIIR